MTVEDTVVLRDMHGSAVALTDVYLGVQHAHVTQAGGMVRYEAGGFIYLDSLGCVGVVTTHTNNDVMSP